MICSCLLQSGQNDSDSSVMAQTSEYGRCCELAYKKDFMKWMETLPQCDFFVNGNREGRREKNRRKGKCTQPQRRWRNIHGNGAAKNLKTSLKTLSEKALHTTETYEKNVCKLFFFFKAPQRGDISRNCCYLYIHSLLFQSMINRWKSLVKGGVDLDLLSLSTSPHPTPPFCALPRLLDSSLPLNPSLLWTEPRSSHVGRVRTCL